ncbi:MAG TPA: methylated-DNA--[protein]-cysteine S-methyltransferase [Acidimicrobiales bacterium]
MSAYVTTTLDSPVGPLTLLASDAGLRAVLWANDVPGQRVPWPAETTEDPSHPVVRAAADQLRAYFDGERRSFEVPLDLHGTAFQVKAWRSLATIAYGETASYADQARLLGDPNKARAAGAANGKNPISIILPCHRVVGARGELTGFAGGLDAKRRLLDFEAAVTADGPVPFPV